MNARLTGAVLTFGLAAAIAASAVPIGRGLLLPPETEPPATGAPARARYAEPEEPGP